MFFFRGLQGYLAKFLPLKECPFFGLLEEVGGVGVLLEESDDFHFLA